MVVNYQKRNTLPALIRFQTRALDRFHFRPLLLASVAAAGVTFVAPLPGSQVVGVQAIEVTSDAAHQSQGTQRGWRKIDVQPRRRGVDRVETLGKNWIAYKLRIRWRSRPRSTTRRARSRGAPTRR